MPHVNDVLSGRGGLINKHPGNVQFIEIIFICRRLSLPSIAFSLYRYSRKIYKEIKAINPSGRFLKYDPETRLWNDIGKKAALIKIRQALREGASELKKHLEDDDTLGQSQQAPIKSAVKSEHRTNIEETESSKAKVLSMREKLRRMSDVSISSLDSGGESFDDDFGGLLSSEFGDKLTPFKRGQGDVNEDKGKAGKRIAIDDVIGKSAEERTQEKSDESPLTKIGQSAKSDSSPESADLLSLPEMKLPPHKKANSSSSGVCQFDVGRDHQSSSNEQFAVLPNIPTEFWQASAPALFQGANDSYSMASQSNINASQPVLSNPLSNMLRNTHLDAAAGLIPTTQNSGTNSNTPVSSASSLMAQAQPNFHLNSSDGPLADQAHLWQSQPMINSTSLNLGQPATGFNNYTPHLMVQAQPNFHLNSSGAPLADQAHLWQNQPMINSTSLNLGQPTTGFSNIAPHLMVQAQPNFQNDSTGAPLSDQAYLWQSQPVINSTYLSTRGSTPYQEQPEIRIGSSEPSYQQLLQFLAQAQGNAIESQQQMRAPNFDGATEDGAMKKNP
ncbi:hypothetical protein ACHAXN_008122 [Cyclotella atomus]